MDRELLSQPTHGGGITRYSNGISVGVRGFLKNKAHINDKEEPWARLAEMAGRSLGALVFFKTRLCVGRTAEGANPTPRQFGGVEGRRITSVTGTPIRPML